MMEHNNYHAYKSTSGGNTGSGGSGGCGCGCLMVGLCILYLIGKIFG